MLDVPPQLAQFLASLGAILALAYVARRLGLGTASVLAGPDEAARVFDEVCPGFRAVQSAIDRDGKGAIARDAQGHVLVVRQHGSQFAGRLLAPASRTRIEGDALVVETGERRFGAVSLHLANPLDWARAVERLGAAGHG